MSVRSQRPSLTNDEVLAQQRRAWHLPSLSSYTNSSSPSNTSPTTSSELPRVRVAALARLKPQSWPSRPLSFLNCCFRKLFFVEFGHCFSPRTKSSSLVSKKMVHEAIPYVTYTNRAKCNVVIGELFVRSQHYFSMGNINKVGGVAAPQCGVLAGQISSSASLSML
jgi:hypothetical protein